MDTVTKASGWKLRVDTPRSVYQDIQQNSKVCIIDGIIDISLLFQIATLCKGHCTLQVVHGIRSGYTWDCAVTTVYNALNVSAWMNLSVTWGWYNFNQKPDNWKLKTKNNWKVKTRKTWDVVVGEHWEQKYVYIP